MSACPCEKKVYTTRKGARRAIRIMRGHGNDRNTGALFHPYRCEYGEIHIGHSKADWREHEREMRTT